LLFFVFAGAGAVLAGAFFVAAFLPGGFFVTAGFFFCRAGGFGGPMVSE
jgi:hypothetical protein